MSLKNSFAWWRWLLEFNPFKYIGLFLMTCGPLYLIYLFLYENLKPWITLLGSFMVLFIGFIFWLNGWDPYETILRQWSAYDFLKSMKEVFGFLEWYKWLLSFSIPKYFALFLMVVGPLFFIYKIIFISSNTATMMIYAGISFVIGTILWIINWDPYS
jgi:hypothetical protein